VSFQLRGRNKDWVIDSLRMFVLDFMFKTFSIVFLEFLLLAPICGAAYCLASSVGQNEKKETVLKKWRSIVNSKYSTEAGYNRVSHSFVAGNTIGFQYSKCRVKEVEPGSQSEKHGVRNEWRILRVCQEPVLNDSYLSRMLFYAHRQHATFEIEFAYKIETDGDPKPEGKIDDKYSSESPSEMTWLSEGEFNALQSLDHKMYDKYLKASVEPRWADSRPNTAMRSRPTTAMQTRPTTAKQENKQAKSRILDQRTPCRM